MKGLWLIPIVAALCGCSDGNETPLSAYRRPADIFARAVPIVQLFGIRPCTTREVVGGEVRLVSTPAEQCYKMLPSRRYRGIWLDEFEGSRFFEAAPSAEAVKIIVGRDRLRGPSGEWLSWAGRIDDKVLPRKSPNSRMMVLDFVGRRTAYPGSYGHFGMSKSYIVVDRLLTARQIYLSTEEYLANEPGLKNATYP